MMRPPASKMLLLIYVLQVLLRFSILMLLKKFKLYQLHIFEIFNKSKKIFFYSTKFF